MYRQEDYADICAQLRKRRTAAYTAAALLFALGVLSFALRWPQALTAALTAAAVCLFVFCYSMLIAPVKAYARHIDHALRGHTHETQGVFAEMESEPVVREGLRLYPMNINVGAGIRDDGNRLFYYDANLPRPDWQPGETLLITSYDNRVVKWTRVKIKS
ncbi:MAG: hypothetical protein IJ157_00155 [Clostridia bacterium]|nr:hypothetical protein [Clostridia bacterium]